MTKRKTLAQQYISIHALVKMATMRFITADKNSFYFNPRPREEGDACACNKGFFAVYFNPRPREEGDFIHDFRHGAMVHFNPRPREEGDHFQRYNRCKIQRFQSTPS